MKNFLIIIGILLVWFSYLLIREPNRDLLIQSAINFSYKESYKNLEDLRKDYPNFTPNIRRWSSRLAVFFGGVLYAVSLPEEDVITQFNGEVRTTRECGSVESRCTLTPPLPPELSVIGRIKIENEDGSLHSDQFNLYWQGGGGSISVYGNCFIAYKQSDKALKIIIEVPGHRPSEVDKAYGYMEYKNTFRYDERIDAGKGYSTGSSRRRISKARFEQLKTCDPVRLNSS